MDFDFCQVLYTAIDEIYSFRLRREKILLLINKLSENNTIGSCPCFTEISIYAQEHELQQDLKKEKSCPDLIPILV